MRTNRRQQRQEPQRARTAEGLRHGEWNSEPTTHPDHVVGQPKPYAEFSKAWGMEYCLTVRSACSHSRASQALPISEPDRDHEQEALGARYPDLSYGVSPTLRALRVLPGVREALSGDRHGDESRIREAPMTDVSLRDPDPLPFAAHSIDAFRGKLPHRAELAGDDYQDLVTVGMTLASRELQGRLILGIYASEVARRAGDLPSDRKREVDTYCRDIGYSSSLMAVNLRMVRYVQLEDLEAYPDLTANHLWAATHLTSRNGEAADAPARQKRVKEALKAAQDENLTPSALRAKLEAERGGAGSLAPNGQVILSPPDDSYAGLRARVEMLEQRWSPERLVDGLEERLEDEEPGSWLQIKAVVLKHLREKLGDTL